MVGVELESCSDSLRRMNEQRPPHTQQISDSDWERTPASVKQLVVDMAQRLAAIEQQLAELQAQNQLLVSDQGGYAAGNTWSSELITSGSKEGAGLPSRAARIAAVIYSRTLRRCDRNVVTTVSILATKVLPAWL